MTVFLYVNPRKDLYFSVTKSAACYLTEQGIAVVLDKQHEEICPIYNVRYLPEEEAFAAADTVITVGGDGTMLHAAHSCLERGTPILGINVGRLGFLATCEPNELHSKLSRFAMGNYTLDERSLLEAKVSGGMNWSATALNDVVIVNGNRQHTMEFSILCDGMPVSHYNSDGVIIATSTGSTAYSLSAGGPILDSHTSSFVVNAICAHSLRNPSIVFSSERKITIQIFAREGDTVLISADGTGEQRLISGCTVEISQSTKKLHIVSFHPAEQFEAIDKKLMGRR